MGDNYYGSPYNSRNGGPQSNPAYNQGAIVINATGARTIPHRLQNPYPIYPIPKGGYATTIADSHKGEPLFTLPEENMIIGKPSVHIQDRLPGLSSTVNGLGKLDDASKTLTEQMRELEQNITVVGIAPRNFLQNEQGNVGQVAQVAGLSTVTNISKHTWAIGQTLGWSLPDPNDPSMETTSREDDLNGRKTLVIKPFDRILSEKKLSDALESVELNNADLQHLNTKTKFIAPETQDFYNAVRETTNASISIAATFLSLCMQFKETRDLLKVLSDDDSDADNKANAIASLVDMTADKKKSVPRDEFLTVFDNSIREPNQPKADKNIPLPTHRELFALLLTNGNIFERVVTPNGAIIDFTRKDNAKSILLQTKTQGAVGYFESNVRKHESLNDRHRIGISLTPTARGEDGDMLLRAAN